MARHDQTSLLGITKCTYQPRCTRPRSAQSIGVATSLYICGCGWHSASPCGYTRSPRRSLYLERVFGTSLRDVLMHTDRLRRRSAAAIKLLENSHHAAHNPLLIWKARVACCRNVFLIKQSLVKESHRLGKNLHHNNSTSLDKRHSFRIARKATIM